jgi:hypothetical protein
VFELLNLKIQLYMAVGGQRISLEIKGAINDDDIVHTLTSQMTMLYSKTPRKQKQNKTKSTSSIIIFLPCLIVHVRIVNQPSRPMRNRCRGCCHDLRCTLCIYREFHKLIGDMVSSIMVLLTLNPTVRC